MPSTLEQLPPELLYYILCKLDGRSLGCASGVNRRWRTIITNLGRVFNIWFRICLKEIGVESIIAQTGLVCLATEAGCAEVQSCTTKWQFWKDLFMANHRCQCVDQENWDVQMHSVGRDSSTDDVTAIAIHPCSHLRGSGKFHAGFRNGKLLYFSMTSLALAAPLAWHVDSCTSTAVLTLDGCPGYHLESAKEEFFALSSSKHGDAMVSHPLLMKWEPVHGLANQVNCISSLGPYFVIASSCSQIDGVVVYRMTQTLNGEDQPHVIDGIQHKAVLRLLGCLHSDMQAVALAHNQVVGGDSHGNLYSWSFAPLSRFDVAGEGENSGARGSSPETMENPSHSMQLDYGIAQVVLHQDCVLVLTNPGKADVFVIHTKDWSRVQRIPSATLRCLTPSFSACATRLAVCANLLAVGFSSGEVLIFTTSKGWTSDLSRHVVSCFRCPLDRLVTVNFTHGPQGPALVVGGDGIIVCQWQKGRGRGNGQKLAQRGKTKEQKEWSTLAMEKS